VKKISEYNINLVNLGDKRHEYDFDLDNSFFELFEQTLVNGGHLKAHVVLDKSPLLLHFEIRIQGEVNLTCDRSLENFDYPMDITETLLVRYGAEALELDDNVLQIPHETQALNMAQHLFDYIGLAIPMKKLHPRFEVDESSEGDILIYSTAQEEQSGPDADAKPDDGPVDPRWEILKKLNNN
jgi:uncharacterized metal-binding protein YceD (DUF177 family)